MTGLVSESPIGYALAPLLIRNVESDMQLAVAPDHCAVGQREGIVNYDIDRAFKRFRALLGEDVVRFLRGVEIAELYRLAVCGGVVCASDLARGSGVEQIVPALFVRLALQGFGVIDGFRLRCCALVFGQLARELALDNALLRRKPICKRVLARVNVGSHFVGNRGEHYGGKLVVFGKPLRVYLPAFHIRSRYFRKKHCVSL